MSPLQGLQCMDLSGGSVVNGNLLQVWDCNNIGKNQNWVYTQNRSEGFPRTGYFILGRDGTGAWQISGIARVSARALLGGFLSCVAVFMQVFLDLVR